MTHVKNITILSAEQRQDREVAQDIKGECIRPGRRYLGGRPAAGRGVRAALQRGPLHSAIGYVAPADKLAGRDQEIFAERDRKLEAARERREWPGKRARPAS